MACSSYNAATFEFQNEILLDKTNENEMLVNWNIQGGNADLADYNVLASGGTKSGCGYDSSYVEFPSSIVLPSKNYSKIYLLVS